MNNPVDEFGKRVCEKRKETGLTQRELAENLNMSRRTILYAETGQSNPKFETVALIARYLGISIDAIIFRDNTSPNAIAKCVYDYFKDKTEEEAEKIVEMCKSIENIK